MGPRYLIISTLTILVISLVIGFIAQKKQPKEIAKIYLCIILGVLIIGVFVYGFVKILIILGVAEGGFTI